MKDQATVQQFIELRAQGLSYRAIAQQLDVALGTLVNWTREQQRTRPTQNEKRTSFVQYCSVCLAPAFNPQPSRISDHPSVRASVEPQESHFRWHLVHSGAFWCILVHSGVRKCTEMGSFPRGCGCPAALDGSPDTQKITKQTKVEETSVKARLSFSGFASGTVEGHSWNSHRNVGTPGARAGSGAKSCQIGPSLDRKIEIHTSFVQSCSVSNLSRSAVSPGEEGPGLTVACGPA
jgi:hypothetical protein